MPGGERGLALPNPFDRWRSTGVLRLFQRNFSLVVSGEVSVGSFQRSGKSIQGKQTYCNPSGGILGVHKAGEAQDRSFGSRGATRWSSAFPGSGLCCGGLASCTAHGDRLFKGRFWIPGKLCCTTCAGAGLSPPISLRFMHLLCLHPHLLDLAGEAL